MSTNVAIFALAAFFEIAGCFAFWLWVTAQIPPPRTPLLPKYRDPIRVEI